MKKVKGTPKRKRKENKKKKKDLHFLCVYEFNVFLY